MAIENPNGNVLRYSNGMGSHSYVFLFFKSTLQKSMPAADMTCGQHLWLRFWQLARTKTRNERYMRQNGETKTHPRLFFSKQPLANLIKELFNRLLFFDIPVCVPDDKVCRIAKCGGVAGTAA